MIAVRVEFLAGRFHANPWDRGTNDGDVDWPPAPWRMLRAITAGWYRAGKPSRPEFLDALDRLAEAPQFLLPQATGGHSRHYMPLGTSKNGKPDTTLVLDSFIALDRERGAAAYVIWPRVDLTPTQRDVLASCCSFIGYLGRSESWCSMELVDEVPSAIGLQSIDLASRITGDGPTVRRLGAGASLRGEGLLSALSETTGEMRKARRLMPIGTTWVEYRLPVDFLLVREQFERRETERPVFGPTLLRFALERGKHTPKPSIKDAIVFAERLRAASIEFYSKLQGGPTSLRLAGKAEDGSARQGHDHPYFLPFDNEGRGEIDGIDVWFPAGCTHAEYRAVTSVPKLYERVFYDDDFPLTFVGSVERRRAQAWQSATPLVLDRFPKMRGSNDERRMVDSPEEQVVAMMMRAGVRPATVEVWPPGRGIERGHGGHLRVDAFRRTRMRKAAPPLPVIGATLHFDEFVDGPIALGRLAHFGLGQFVPVSEETERPI
ncbi:MAG TPA: type I-U CRISPR-associated protein Csb2 [Candidatus Acidoferrales bacterium]|nr:type I-U CRISPR-associated protein Csb2 [Candidatus Acidoferrales bacterium]